MRDMLCLFAFVTGKSEIDESSDNRGSGDALSARNFFNSVDDLSRYSDWN